MSTGPVQSGVMAEAVALTDLLCEDRLPAEGAARLERLVREHRDVRRRYVRTMHLHAGLHLHWSVLGVQPEEPWIGTAPSAAGMDETMVMGALRDEANPAPKYGTMPVGVLPDGRSSRFERLPEPVKKKSIRPAWWGALAACAVGLAVAGVFWKRGNAPGPAAAEVAVEVEPPVASIVAQAGAMWADPPPADGNLHGGQALSLTAGCVRLTFAGGAAVIIEGPSHFTTESATELSLASGKAAATVRGGGFVITTPSARVRDLGTELGVAVDGAGATDVEVFKGRVEAQPLPTAKAAAAPAQVLGEGAAAQVRSGAMAVEEGAALPQHFVRTLAAGPVALDLVDLLSGGDGTTRREGFGIDATNGRSGKLATTAGSTGDYQFHRVPGLTVVDGAFIPEGGKGPVVVDSAGDRFAFPPTANESYNHIWAGGPMPTPPGDTAIAMHVGGVDFSPPAHTRLFMSADKGVTLDLAAIGRLHPDVVLSGFRCRVGLGGPSPNLTGLADAYVLVDGRAVFEQHHFNARHEPFKVDVPLRPGQRFITLAVTDGGDSINNDGVLWCDAVFTSAAP